MSKNTISEIVDELINLEPSFAKHKDILQQNIKAIISAKPDTKFTPSFKKKLLSELRTHIAAAPTSTSSPLEIMQKLLYAISGAAVASIALYITVINPTVPQPIVEVEESAEIMMKDGEDTDEPMPAVANYDMASTRSFRPQSGGGGGGYGMAEPAMPYHYMGMEYMYDGDIELPDTKEIVAFKRSRLDERQTTNLLENTFVGNMLDVSRLKSLNVISIALSEEGDEPLVMNVDFRDGNVGLQREIDYSKLPQNKCRDEKCWERYRLKQSDMLSEDRTISIASSFLKDLGVDLAQYGEPSLQDDWRMRYAMTPQKSSFYYPEQVSVTFPYLINGMPVYDESGNFSGVSVSIDMRLKTAMSVWGLRKMNLSEKTYKPVSDPEIIRKSLRTGGAGNYVPEDLDREKAELADPKTAYLMKYVWDEKTQIGFEVYVPALVFPVRKFPEQSYEFRKAVIIPLAEELIHNQEEHEYPMPMPMPMEPMVEPVDIEMMEGQAG